MRTRWIPAPRLPLLLPVLLLAFATAPAESEEPWTWIGPEWASCLSLGVDTADVVYMGGLYMGVMFTTDQGTTWQEFAEPGEAADIATSSSGTVFVSDTWGTGIWRTSDHGVTWTSITDGLPSDVPILQVAVLPGNGHVFAGSADVEIYRSTDDGLTWAQTASHPTEWDLQDLAGSPSNRLYAAADDALWRSDDEGATWAELTTPLVLPLFVVVGADESVLSGEDDLYRSTDHGATWTSIGGGIVCPDFGAESAAFGATPAEIYLAGATCGVQHSTDTGATWTAMVDGLDDRFVQGLALDSEGRVFAATYSNGVYMHGGGGANHVTASAPAAGLRLAPNAPNPFRAATTLTFSLEQAGRATVAVYDATGRRRAVVADCDFAAGAHSLTWGGRDAADRAMPSGVYFVRLATDREVRAQKIHLLR